MLAKVISIKSVGRFKDYKASGDVTLKRLNVFFGPNGRGKTTLCEILRALSTANHEIINGRRTLAATDAPVVEIRSITATYCFRNGSWNAAHPDLAIFDANFVNANIYSGEVVSLDNKRNLYRVIVGERGVELAKEVENLDELLRASAKRVGSAKSRVEKLVPKGTDTSAFMKLSPVDDVVKKLENARKQVATLEKAAEIKAKSLLKPLSLYSPPTDFLPILASSIPDVAAAATTIVDQHIASHTSGATPDWLATGLQYIQGTDCPFCGVANSDSSLFAAYRTVFSKAFAELRERILGAQSQLRATNAEEFGRVLVESHRANVALCEYWQQFVDIAIPEPLVSSYVTAMATVVAEASRLIDRKLADPLQPLADAGAFSQSLADLAIAAENLSAYNNAIAAANSLIQKQKAEADAGSLPQQKAELASFQTAQIRHQPDGVAACDELNVATEEREQLEKRKQQAKEELDAYTESIFGKYQDRINLLLANFGAGFRIQNAVRNYAGGTPSTSYHLVIDEVAVDIGDNKSPIDKPSFRNTLSAGDRSALAFAFFVARAQLDGDLPRKILVFDDPFSSQDRSRRACTQQIICKLAQDAAQVIVLSHDRSFLREVWDGAHTQNERKPLQLSRMGRDTIISEWDIEHDTKPSYMQQHALLKGYVCESKGHPLQVARAIRPIMEEYLRLTFPNQFAGNEWLGNFIEKIRAADDTTVLKSAQPHLSEIEAINDYSKRFHHSGITDSDDSIDDTELATYCTRVLDLIEGF